MFLILALALLSTISYADAYFRRGDGECLAGPHIDTKVNNIYKAGLSETQCEEHCSSMGPLCVGYSWQLLYENKPGDNGWFCQNYGSMEIKFALVMDRWSPAINPQNSRPYSAQTIEATSGSTITAPSYSAQTCYQKSPATTAPVTQMPVTQMPVVPPSRHWVTKGRNGGDPRCDSRNEDGDEDCSTKFELDNSDHGVRCCKHDRESHNSGVMKKTEGCAVFGGSRMRPQNNCHYPKTMRYSTALWWCESAGARLCTIKELKDNCAAGTGCGLDFRTVWSSDDDANLDHSPITKIPTLKPSTFHTPKLHYAAPRFHDRSLHPCMDSEPCNTVQKLNNNVHAVSCCKNTPDHMWFRQDLIPRCRLVWSASGQGLKHKDQCTKGTWYEAKHVCEANGARLCSRQELDAGCAKSTGCQFDGLLNWSNDAAGMT